MADWSQPIVSSNYLDVLTNLKERDVDALTLLSSTPTNTPTNAIRFARTPEYKFQEYDGASFVDRLLGITGGGTGASTATGARSNLGLGTIATQNSNAVAISGGTISGITSLGVNGTPVFSGGLIAGSGVVGIIGADGRIPAISSTYFASLSGANLTGILESAITDGAILARVAANETISGTWTFSNLITASAGISSGSNITATGSTISGAVGNFSSSVAAAPSGVGTVALRGIAAGSTGVEIHIRANASKNAYVTLTEDSVADRWAIGSDASAGELKFRAGSSTGTIRMQLTNTGVLQNSDGGVSAPSITFINDADTGLYSAGANNLGIAVGGSVMWEMGGSRSSSQVNQVLEPYADNTFRLGSSDRRWTIVYATTGTINTSDERQKREIEPIANGLDFIRKLRPVSYKWRVGSDRTMRGLIAQEIAAIDPSYVWGDEARGYGLNYSEFIAPLIAAVQELYGLYSRIQKD